MTYLQWQQLRTLQNICNIVPSTATYQKMKVWVAEADGQETFAAGSKLLSYNSTFTNHAIIYINAKFL